jgi:hypothetical protein
MVLYFGGFGYSFMHMSKHGSPAMVSTALENFVDESVRHSRESGYNPTAFNVMREHYGTIGAIERLVASGEIQSGFIRLQQMELVDWTIEAAVLKFPKEFSRDIRDAAQWRLEQAKQVHHR